MRINGCNAPREGEERVHQLEGAIPAWTFAPNVVSLVLRAPTCLSKVGVGGVMTETCVGGDCALPGGGVNWRGCLPKSIGSGIAVGFLTGLFGVGGGFLIIPALVLLLGLPMTVAVGTSLVIVTLNSAAGFAAHAGNTQLDWQLLTSFTAAAVVGSLLAGRLGKRVDSKRLQRGFAVLVLLTAVGVIVGVATG